MRSTPLPEPIRSRLRSVVDLHGEIGAAERLGIHRQTVLRAIAGRPILAGTHALIRARLDGDA